MRLLTFIVGIIAIVIGALSQIYAIDFDLSDTIKTTPVVIEGQKMQFADQLLIIDNLDVSVDSVTFTVNDTVLRFDIQQMISLESMGLSYPLIDSQPLVFAQDGRFVGSTWIDQEDVKTTSVTGIFSSPELFYQYARKGNLIALFTQCRDSAVKYDLVILRIAYDQYNIHNTFEGNITDHYHRYKIVRHTYCVI